MVFVNSRKGNFFVLSQKFQPKCLSVKHMYGCDQWSGFIDKNYLYPGLMLNAWSLYLQILHVLRFHHSPGGLVGNSGCSSVHLSASVSLSLLPATSRVYFSFLFSSPQLSSPSHWSILIISVLFLIPPFSSSHDNSGASFCYHGTNSPSSFYFYHLPLSFQLFW